MLNEPQGSSAVDRRLSDLRGSRSICGPTTDLRVPYCAFSSNFSATPFMQ